MASNKFEESRDEIWDSSEDDDGPNHVSIQCNLDLEELAYRKKKADEMKAALAEAIRAKSEAEEKWAHREHVDSLAAKYRKDRWDEITNQMEQVVKERDLLREENDMLKREREMMDKARKDSALDKDVDSNSVDLSKAKDELLRLQREVGHPASEAKSNVNEQNTDKTTIGKSVAHMPTNTHEDSPKKDPRPLQERYSKEDWSDYIRRRREAIANPTPDAQLKAFKMGGENWRSHISRFIKVPFPKNKLPLPDHNKTSDA